MREVPLVRYGKQWEAVGLLPAPPLKGEAVREAVAGAHETTPDTPQHYRAPSVRVARRVGPRLTEALEALHVCPVCGEGRFQATELKTTVLLVCDLGCNGRRIAVALGLDGWPEMRS